VAHYQLRREDKIVPVVVGVRFLGDSLIKKMLATQNHHFMSIVDVYVASIGDMTEEKMALVQELWSHKIRAEANFQTNPQAGEILKYCKNNNIRLLVTFKKVVYNSSNKVKVKDLEKKTESDEIRDTLVKVIKLKLAHYS